MQANSLPTLLQFCSQSFVLHNMHSLDEDYLMEDKIGEGCFGTVYKVKHRKLNLQRAVKVIRKRMNGVFSSFEQIQVLKKLDHPNILKIYQFYQTNECYYMITDIFPGIQLFEYISNQQSLSPTLTASILIQLITALQYTHSLGIAHRDLKPQNILISDRRGKIKIKVIDWGLGTIGKEGMQRVCGTPEYCAPQVLAGQKYGLQCDMWSVGCLAYVMLTGEMPFEGDNTQETIKSVQKGLSTRNPSLKKLSPTGQSFITSLIVKDPAKRMTPAQSLAHPFLQISIKQPPSHFKQTLQKLKQINLTHVFGTAVISYINNHMSSEEERDKLEEIFKFLDKNGDGVISKEELAEGYINLYGKEVGKSISDEIFNKLDTNHNGSLQFSQFLSFSLTQPHQLQHLRHAFSLFDRNGDGKISIHQICNILKVKLDTDEDIEKIVKEFDGNGDGQIDWDEFVQGMEVVYNKFRGNISKPIQQEQIKHKQDIIPQINTKNAKKTQQKPVYAQKKTKAAPKRTKTKQITKKASQKR